MGKKIILWVHVKWLFIIIGEWSIWIEFEIEKKNLFYECMWNEYLL